MSWNYMQNWIEMYDFMLPLLSAHACASDQAAYTDSYWTRETVDWERTGAGKDQTRVSFQQGWVKPNQRPGTLL